MSDRILMSEQEILQKFGQPIIRFRDNWTHSDVYYDADNDRFVEERYHEEYLDTGTVCDGCFLISNEEIWDKLVKHCDEDGMEVYLQYRDHAPIPYKVSERISIEDFQHGILALYQKKPWRRCFYEQLGSTTIITNEVHNIIGVVGETKRCYFFYDANNQKIGFHALEEALAFALKQATIYHNYRTGIDAAQQEKSSLPSAPPPKKSLLDRFKRGRTL